MSDSVYEICPICHNSLRALCQACQGNGFIRTGLTTAQVEAHAEDAKRIQYVKALGLSVIAPSGENGWLVRTGFQPGRGMLRFRGDSPRSAIDAAIKGLGL